MRCQCYLYNRPEFVVGVDLADEVIPTGLKVHFRRYIYLGDDFLGGGNTAVFWLRELFSNCRNFLQKKKYIEI